MTFVFGGVNLGMLKGDSGFSPKNCDRITFAKENLNNG
jgi:hypothetical protein